MQLNTPRGRLLLAFNATLVLALGYICYRIATNHAAHHEYVERVRIEEERCAAEKAQAERTIHMTDSLLSDLVPRINAFTADRFEYEKTTSDDLGRFRPKGSDPGENPRRSYLRAAVDDYGRTQLIATYCGPRSFCVQQLRLRTADGAVVTTASIAPNDGANYLYEITGTHYQAVTFMHADRVAEAMTQNAAAQAYMNTDNDALAFIAMHATNATLRCLMLDAAGHEQPLAVSRSEWQQMADVHQLGLMLRESIRLQQEHNTASLQLEHINNKQITH